MTDEEAPAAPSTPAAPRIPGASFCGGLSAEQAPNGCGSILKSCKCFKFEERNEEGELPTYSIPAPPVSLAKKVGGEFVGTFMLVFAGTATAILNQKTHGRETLIGLASSTGLAVMVIISSTGHISGAHLNPAVTIAFAALKHFPLKHVPVYIGAQVAASLTAAFALKVLFNPIMSGGVTVPGGGCGQAFALEFIVSFNLMFVVTAMATDTRAVKELAGIAVGATVMLNILIAGETTGASMNPVRTLGPAVAAKNFKALWVYLTAPILGALCGAGTYSAVKLPEEGSHTREKPPMA